MGAPATGSYMAEAGRGFKRAAIEERRADAHLAETIGGVVATALPDRCGDA